MSLSLHQCELFGWGLFRRGLKISWTFYCRLTLLHPMMKESTLAHFAALDEEKKFHNIDNW
jgi:hypothetical protein